MTPKHYITMRYIVRMSRKDAEADYILSQYEQMYGWMHDWPARVLYRCRNAIMEATA